MKIPRRKALLALGTTAVALPLVVSAQSDSKTGGSSGSNQKPLRIAVMHFAHETVTFLPYDTTTDDFIYEGSPAKGEALLGSAPIGYIGGFVNLCREYANVELVGIESPLGSKKGSGSGWITKEAFDHFADRMMADLKAQGHFDAAYLSLHGAMGVRDVAKPEAELARRVREVVGPKAFIAGTFDPHGNEDGEFLKYANFAFTIKYYPHYDGYLQGERAARCLIRAARGAYKPVSTTRKPPILTPSVLQWTGASPWMDIVQRCLTWESREPDVFVNFFYGFAFGDAVDGGMCFQVMANGNPELANFIADDIASAAWRAKDDFLNHTKVYRHAEAVKLAKETMAKDPTAKMVLADHSDRTGAATWLLQQIIEQGLSNTLIGTVADEDLINTLRKKGVKVGDAFDYDVGGRIDVSAGKPVRIKGTVVSVSGGPSVRKAGTQMWVGVKFGDNNVLLISPFLAQIIHPETFLPLGINTDQFKAIAIKSRVHFHRGFTDTGYCKYFFLTEPEQPFVGTVRLESLPYKYMPIKNLYPYNKNATFTVKGPGKLGGYPGRDNGVGE